MAKEKSIDERKSLPKRRKDFPKWRFFMVKLSLPHYHGEDGREECLKEQLDRPGDFQAVADIFKLLDDTSRVRIF